MDTSEKRFEQDIETYFLNHGFRKVLPSTYDKEKNVIFWYFRRICFYNSA